MNEGLAYIAGMLMGALIAAILTFAICADISQDKIKKAAECVKQGNLADVCVWLVGQDARQAED